MSIFVKKADGTRQAYDRGKVIRTLKRMGASKEVTNEIVTRIELKLFDGITTQKILQMIFRLLKRYKPAVQHRVDLRKALSLMKPAPDFERFVQILLREHDYTVTPNQIVHGRCGDHEVDAIARKDGVTYLVEVKHHYKYHTPTGFDVSRIAWAILEDVMEGRNVERIDTAMIVCNTKLSEHAKRYGRCRGIHHIGWSAPPNHGLQTMIEAKNLYPVTCLKGLDTTTKNTLSSAGIVLLKQLVEQQPKGLGRATGIPNETLDSLSTKARTVLTDK